MNVRFCLVSGVLLLLPVGVRVPGGGSGAGGPDATDSSPHLVFDLLGGRGSYSIVPRDCAGNAVAPPQGFPYGEVSGRAELGVEYVSVGIRGGLLQIRGDGRTTRGFPVDSPERDIWYWNPYLALDSKYAGIGAGLFQASDELPLDGGHGDTPFSGHLRLGPRRVHAKLSVMEGQPIASGGGYVQLGVGFASRQRDSFFVGLSAMPYDGAGLAGSMDLSISEQFSLLARTRIGSTEGQFEGGLALGLRWHAIR